MRPFLENVIRGRGVPPERLDAVEEHYRHFGGVSPLNARNRDADRGRAGAHGAAGVLRQPQLASAGRGHRRRDGARRGASRGGVRDKRLRRLLGVPAVPRGHRAGPQGGRGRRAGAGEAAALLRPPAFVAANADAVRGRARHAPRGGPRRARLVFTAHSVPTAADATAGPSEGGHRYSRQVADAARLVAAELGLAEYDVVWQSRSGPPQVPVAGTGHRRPPRHAGRGGRPRPWSSRRSGSSPTTSR